MGYFPRDVTSWQPARTAESSKLNFNQLPESLETQHVKTDVSGQLRREQRGAAGTSELSRGWQTGVEMFPSWFAQSCEPPRAGWVRLVLPLSPSLPRSQAGLPTTLPQTPAPTRCDLALSKNHPWTRLWDQAQDKRMGPRGDGTPGPPQQKAQDTLLLQA